MIKSLVPFIFIFCFSSGLRGQCFPDRHNTNWNDGWLSCEISPNPNPNRAPSHWIQYDLGDVYVLGQSHFWNSNVPDSTNRGFNEVAIDYSIDGINWSEWGTFIMPEASGSGFYEGAPGPSLNGASARYVLLTALSNYGGECYGFSEARFGIQNTPVPVELVEFTVECFQEFATVIKWKPSTEINNNYYSLERSVDGRNWEFISQIPGKTNSFSVQEYSYIDNEYVVGSKFYRLNQTDQNGRSQIIDVREIECAKGSSRISVVPNPFTDVFNIRIEIPFDSHVDYYLADVLGRLVKMGQFDTQSLTAEFTVHTENLKPGSYALTVLFANTQKQFILVKI